MRKLYIGIAIFVIMFLIVFSCTAPTIDAEEITTTTTTQEEITTTISQDEEITTTADPLDEIQDEAEVFITKLEALVTAFVTSILGSTVLIGLGKVLIDKAIKKFTEKVRLAEAQNKISSERADQLVTALNVAQTTANAKIDSLQADVRQMHDENAVLHGSVSELLAELRIRDERIGALIEATLGTVGESDGQE
jgi:UPF0716 family protein affecting phage T7 exclusion